MFWIVRDGRVLTMNGMATRKSKAQAQAKETPQSEPEEVWRLFTKIDVTLKARMEAYMASLEYPVDQARIIERAFREFLEKRNF
jgi:hypothetical protein